MTLLTLSAAFLAGVFLGLHLQLPFMALGLFALAAGLSWLLLLIAKRPALPTVLILAAVVGAAIATPPGDAADARLAAFRGVGTLQVEGVVATDPEAVESAMRVRLAVDRIRRGEDWVEASGDVLVTLHVTPELVRRRESPHVRYGDRLLLEGALRTPPELEGFDYPAYLARQGIGTVMSFPRVTLVQEGEGRFLSRWLHGLRRRMADSIAKAVPEPQASLGQALLLVD